MAKPQNKNKVRFIRKGGRIIPIRDERAARGILHSQNKRELATIMGATAAGFGGGFLAGKIQRKSDSLMAAGFKKKSGFLNRGAKILKFGSKAVPALIAGSALVAIDRKVKDEGTIFDIGKTTGAFNIAVALGGGYLAARTFKRFEKFGLRGGKFPFKIRDI